MKKPMKKLMNKNDALVLVAAPPVAVLAGSAVTPGVPAEPEVVATAKRRQFSGSERRRNLAAADRCTVPGEIGAVLPRAGIYSSTRAAWRKKRVAMVHRGLG